MAHDMKALDEIADEWREDGFAIPRADVPQTVYHYTDAAGLQGMLATGKIWATEAWYLNDREEIRHFTSAACKHVADRLQKEKNDAMKRLFRKIAVYQNIPSPDFFFIFSLSSKRDDLSQWRGYAREGRGFTIGLSGPELLSYSKNAKSAFRFARVEYDHEKQKRSIESSLRELGDRVRFEIDTDEDAASEIIDEAARLYDQLVETRAAMNKHKSFEGEQEWRVLAFVPQEDENGDVKVRTRGESLVPYIEMSLSDADKLPIQCIGVGPGFTGPEQKRAVEILCKNHGYDVEVYQADSPFRRV